MVLLATECKIFAQHVMGTVFEIKSGNKIPMIGVTVYFPGTSMGTITDETGMFHINKPSAHDSMLVFSYIGYLSDTLHADGMDMQVELKSSAVLENFTLKGSDTYISQLNPIKTEVLGGSELRKNACCNLSESFEASPTVDVSFADAVTGARQIQMLGLAGKYVQIMTDVLPTVRGMNSTFGLDFIPSSWVQSISVNKGTGSVVNGFESITGQIDVELKKPEKTDKLFLNLYGGSDNRLEANLNLGKVISDKWSTLLMVHGNNLQSKMDENQDSFLDMPNDKQFSLMNRWKYMSLKRLETMFGVKAIYDDKQGGQLNFEPANALNDTVNYGFGLTTKRAEVFLKGSVNYPLKSYKSLGLQLNAVSQSSEGYFGMRKYTGDETNYYANLIYESVFNNTNHKFRTGLSMQMDNNSEAFDTLNLEQSEIVPGAFFEYTLTNDTVFTLLLGIRADYSNQFGFFVTPRLHLKITPAKETAFRFSVGTGTRTSNILAENPAVLSSSRQIIISENLLPEKAINVGFNFTKTFDISYSELTWSSDFYRTDFFNQTVVDLDLNPQQVVFSNLHGKSFANSFQTDLNLKLNKHVEARAAYKFYDVLETYHDQLMQKTLTPKHRAMFNAAYTTTNSKWKFDFTTQWIGEQRLPNTNSNPEVYQLPVYSPSYFRLLGQISFVGKHWEIYAGSENITNYKQSNPILAADHPFSDYFDSSIVWGPITGRTFYTGLRFKI